MPDPFQRAAGGALFAYVLFLAFVLGQSDASLASSVVVHVAEVLGTLGAPGSLASAVRVEFLLNAAMFAPLPLLAALTCPRHPWANWVVYGFVGSIAVELVQALWLPLRSAQYVDIVSNTAGSLAGAMGSILIQRVWSRGRAPLGVEKATCE